MIKSYLYHAALNLILSRRFVNKKVIHDVVDIGRSSLLAPRRPS